VLGFVELREDSRLLIGLETPDDAAVYRLGEDQAIVASLDFFAPVVDDPVDFGAIAAANALSDLYAMRARPLFALNILAVQLDQLGGEVVGAILRGASETCAEAGISIAGGHSIDDPEPKFGLVVLGTVDPETLWRKSSARPGNAIVLGKALGTGVITTALKQGTASPGSVAAAVSSMRRLNQEAAAVLARYRVDAATDVTGYGLLGHLTEVCRASGVAARVRASAPELLPGAIELAAEGIRPGGTDRNRRWVEEILTWADPIDEARRVLLCDAQTSGGLLACLPEEEAESAADELREAGYAAAVVGSIEEGEPHIFVEE
jgi:selenide,water dikinase